MHFHQQGSQRASPPSDAIWGIGWPGLQRREARRFNKALFLFYVSMAPGLDLLRPILLWSCLQGHALEDSGHALEDSLIIFKKPEQVV